MGTDGTSATKPFNIGHYSLLTHLLDWYARRGSNA